MDPPPRARGPGQLGVVRGVGGVAPVGSAVTQKAPGPGMRGAVGRDRINREGTRDGSERDFCRHHCNRNDKMPPLRIL